VLEIALAYAALAVEKNELCLIFVRFKELPRSKLRGIQTARNEASFVEFTPRD